MYEICSLLLISLKFEDIFDKYILHFENIDYICNTN